MEFIPSSGMNCLKSGLFLLSSGWGESDIAILNETLLSTM